MKRRRTKELVQLSLLLALILIQTWVPFLGNINIPPLSITFVHVTVIVTTLTLGTREGVIVGTFWGLNSWIRAVIMPISPLHTMVLSNPLISVVPRILMPLIIGKIYEHLSTDKQQSKSVYGILGGLGSLLNTVILLGFIGLFQANSGMAAFGVESHRALWLSLMGIVTANGMPEMIFSAMVTPIVVIALKKTIR